MTSLELFHVRRAYNPNPNGSNFTIDRQVAPSQAAIPFTVPNPLVIGGRPSVLYAFFDGECVNVKLLKEDDVLMSDDLGSVLLLQAPVHNPGDPFNPIPNEGLHEGVLFLGYEETTTSGAAPKSATTDNADPFALRDHVLVTSGTKHAGAKGTVTGFSGNNIRVRLEATDSPTTLFPIFSKGCLTKIKYSEAPQRPCMALPLLTERVLRLNLKDYYNLKSAAKTRQTHIISIPFEMDEQLKYAYVRTDPDPPGAECANSQPAPVPQKCACTKGQYFNCYGFVLGVDAKVQMASGSTCIGNVYVEKTCVGCLNHRAQNSGTPVLHWPESAENQGDFHWAQHCLVDFMYDNDNDIIRVECWAAKSGQSDLLFFQNFTEEEVIAYYRLVGYKGPYELLSYQRN